ncbi:hypothetical protein EV193_10867 [Herbihabitans rhizosphaerae]|uniref:Uncharacterized protein n=1 Tax=Herbihabitans rhizosphaerae TaxID=1872711 RepID=A0A4Q7KHT5_9PSEU|nr:hypothetical protein [Herbihabitans rhizosphaerae]RZS34719.1 hypothetical protein EV193_10867 [Herbihabitans rhizosphaerae]
MNNQEDGNDAEAQTNRKRKLGGWEGKVWYSPDCDDADQEIAEMFYGEEDASTRLG